MKNKTLLIVGSSVCLLFTLFSGCGERSGEKEYNKAMASWKNGDLSRAQGQMEKAIKRLSDKEKKSMANNQLGIIQWNLGKKEQALERFDESCRLTEDLTGANMNRGIALYHMDQVDQAKFEFTNILGEQTRNTMARTFVGLIHMQKKEWKSAEREIATGLKVNPSDPAGQNALAIAQLHTDNSSNNAIARLKQIVNAHPDYAPAAYNLGVIYDQWLHDTPTALDWYKKYLQQAQSDTAHVEKANQAIARLSGKATKSTLQAPKRSNPTAAAQHIAAGSKLHSEKKYREAISRYQQAIQADPSQKNAYYNMGLSYYELKQYAEAATACINTLKLDPSASDPRYMLALSYAKQSKWSDAEREAKALKQVDPTRGESMLKYISTARKR